MPAAADGPVILVMGDSLSAAYGLAQNEGWVSLLQRRLRGGGFPHRVINASISGETSDGALARIQAVLERWQPAIVILETGANDGLRGLPLARLRKNLEALIDACRRRDARVLLVGMRLPPNYGPDYTRDFARLYADLARGARVPLVPFLLEGVALDPGLFQSDGLHPNGRAQARILDNVWTALRPLLDAPPPPAPP